MQQVIGDNGLGHAQLQLAGLGRHGNHRIITDDLVANLVDQFGNHRIDLAGHNGRSRLHGRQVDFVQAATRSRGHPAQVVADFGNLNGGPFHGGRHLGKSAGILGGLHQVGRPAQLKTTDFRQFPGDQIRISRRAVQAGADGRGPHVDGMKFFAGSIQGRHGALDHHGIGGKFLAQRHGNGVLIFRAPHFKHIGKLGRLGFQRLFEFIHRTQQVFQ